MNQWSVIPLIYPIDFVISIAACLLRSSVVVPYGYLVGGSKAEFLPRPLGLIPPKPAMLSTTNGT